MRARARYSVLTMALSLSANGCAASVCAVVRGSDGRSVTVCDDREDGTAWLIFLPLVPIVAREVPRLSW